ncbi:MAG: class I SAM-dependent methyltransferase [Gemmatimonadales bacterium]|nr:class I SAM-dependent methyltransferase [Gemmatimonadales bacterium]
MSVITTQAVDALIADLERDRGPGASVLEAGCGRFKHFAYPDTMRIAGLDISSDQLKRNTYAHEKFLGDVQTYESVRQFDVVVSIFVLEHLNDPQAALANMLAWTKPGGLLILAVPNVLSVKGLVTKFTPFWFHHLAYKIIYRSEYSIFPTTMKFCIAPKALKRFFAGHEIVHQEYGEENLARPFNYLYRGLMGAMQVLSLGFWHPERSNYQLVIRKSD